MFGATLALMGVWVLGATAWHVFVLGTPRAKVLGLIGFLALAANVASVLILIKYNDSDANVRSDWLCSRNDARRDWHCRCDAGRAWRLEYGQRLAGRHSGGDLRFPVPELGPKSYVRPSVSGGWRRDASLTSAIANHER